MAKTVVILGANYTGIPIAHWLLKHIAAKVKGGLKVILVSPNTDMYWNVASVRAILPGDLMPDEKVFLPIAPSFKKYPAGQFEFVVGKAKQLNPSGNIVEVQENNGALRTISYDEVVIATGSSSREGTPFKNLSSTDETKAVLQAWREQIQAAKSIVVAGGGLTGVEIAGELGQEYASKGKKDITFIVDGDLPLTSILTNTTRETARKELEKLKVKIITNTRTTRVAGGEKGTTLELTSTATGGKKQTLKADMFIPAYGVVPNTSFLPREMLDADGFVKQTRSLRAEGHSNVFVVGDAGNLEISKGKNADAQVVHLVKILEAKILGTAEPAEYAVDPKVMVGLSIGRNRGTGQMGSWTLWSLPVWYLKSRYQGTEYAQAYVDGLRTMTVSKNW